MTTRVTSSDAASPAGGPGNARRERFLVRLGLRFTAWAERWFPDAYVFACLGVAIVAAAAMANGAAPGTVAKSFGEGWWSLITFTMQMAIVAIGGYVVATAPPVAVLIGKLAGVPRTGAGAVAFVAAASTLTSLLSWGLSLVFSGLLVRALARRTELRMDYRAAGAAAYLGLGATWALGLSSSAAQLQANAASLPKALLPITGVIPFAETIFLWQSLAIAATLIVASIVIARLSSPSGPAAVTMQMLAVDAGSVRPAAAARLQRPGDWLEHSPLLTVLIVALGGLWLVEEFASKDPIVAISNLNTYNLLFLLLGMLLHWRPRSFMSAVTNAVPTTAGVLIQFPLYGAIAAILTGAKGAGGHTLADQIAHAFVSLTTTGSFPVAMGAYSAVLGFFVPSGGGKWVVEAPYVMQAANDLKVHLGWAVQIYNAAEALPNLVNPFWMLPLLGILGLRARDLVGFTFLQLIVHVPLVLFLLWLLAPTLPYHPPVAPTN
jgi:short-chain fatty acids transporter